MPHSKWMIALLATTVASAGAYAESIRSVFTPENRFPRWGQLEAGVHYAFIEENDDQAFQDVNATAITPYLRYGLSKELALRVDVPFIDIDPSTGGGQTGIGDVEVSLQLRAYQDVFEFPFIIPHVSVSLPTGDEDKGLGDGEVVITPGLAIGTMTYDTMTWVFDASYRIHPDEKNQVLLSGAFIYDVSPDLAFLLEIRYEDEAQGKDSDAEVLVLAGMSYDWTDSLQTGFHFGTAIEGDTDVIVALRASYSF